MSEYKQLHELIGQMREGDIAEARAGSHAPICHKGKKYVYLGNDGRELANLPVVLTPEILKREYRIRLRYIDFSRALEELYDGKVIDVYDHLGIHLFYWTNEHPLEDVFHGLNLTSNDLVNGNLKFTVKGRHI